MERTRPQNSQRRITPILCGAVLCACFLMFAATHATKPASAENTAPPTLESKLQGIYHSYHFDKSMRVDFPDTNPQTGLWKIRDNELVYQVGDKETLYEYWVSDSPSVPNVICPQGMIAGKGCLYEDIAHKK